MKKILGIVLALLLVTALGASAYAADDVASPKTQLQLIESQIGNLTQDASTRTWYYCVTDMDHDGCLEFLAASLHPADRSTNLKVWIVSPDATALNACQLALKNEDESFPDIMADTVDTYHVKDTDTWYYMVNDNVVISDSEVYTVKTAVNLKDGVLGYDAYAVEHTVVDANGNRNVSCTDMTGLGISADQYNAAGVNNFAGAARSNTAFEWLVADEIGNLDRLTESYEVFLGTREPTEVFPVPKPVALGGDPTPTPTPAPQPAPPTYLMITKNPTNENHNVGENAIFVALANAYESLNWTFVSPNGGEFTPANFLAGSGASILGETSTTITVVGLEDWMNGWGAYCTFYFKGQTARTSTAYMYVNSTPPTPPAYGTMSGSAYEAGGGYAINLQSGDQVYVDAGICNIEGQFYDGCTAMVYYTDYPSSDNIYHVDMWGHQGFDPPDLPDPPEPTYGTIGGSAHEGGGGYAIDLDNGDQVYVDAGICNVEGQFYDGCSALVYYTDYPSSDNIYQVNIFGNQGLLIPDTDDDGGDDDSGQYYTGLIMPT